MSYGYMFLSQSDPVSLMKVRGCSFLRLDAGQGWHAFVRLDHEGGRIVHPLADGGRLTPFEVETLRVVRHHPGICFCFFLLDRHVSEQQIVSRMKQCLCAPVSLLPPPDASTPIRLGAVYRLA